MIEGQTINMNASPCPLRNIVNEMAKTDVTMNTKACNPITPIGTMLDYSI